MSDHLTLFKWQSYTADEVHNYTMCTTLSDAMEAQQSMRHIFIMENKVWRLCCCYNFTMYKQTFLTQRKLKKQTTTRETKALAERGVNTKRSEQYKDNKRNIIYTFNECACPKLLFLITFPCDIICCKIVYAWGTFSSCQLKSIWTNQYLSILWHTHSWPLGKSCLK